MVISNLFIANINQYTVGYVLTFHIWKYEKKVCMEDKTSNFKKFSFKKKKENNDALNNKGNLEIKLYHTSFDTELYT